jgi:multiple sugar transport system substrate-binding protein
MNNFVRKAATVMTAAAAVVMAAAPAMAHAQAKTTITWLVGLGTGTDPQQIAAQKKVVDEFNASHSDITLAIQISPDFASTVTLLGGEIAAGNGPDIIGPVGVGGSNGFASQYADLKPFIDKNKVDLSVYDPSLLSLYQTLNGGFSALPFAVYPSATYYNRDLFTEAGLSFPPAKYGDKYKMPDGTMVDWNYDTAAKISQILTVDSNGNDATSAKFDPTKIVQWGLGFGYDAPRLILTNIQPSAFYDPASNAVKISDDWRKALQWYSDAIWKTHIIPNATSKASTLLQPTPFDSGHVAMTITPLWFTCCLTDTVGKLKWDLGVVPMSPDGKYHNAIDADTFRLYKGSKNPDAAFSVLQYLLNDAVPELAPAYGAFPAQAKYQQGWIDSKNKTYTQGVNWQAAIDGLKYSNPSNLHHESNSPNWQQGQDRWQSFITLLESDNGAKIDLKAEVDKLEADLNSIVKGTFPTATPVPTVVPTAAATAAK